MSRKQERNLSKSGCHSYPDLPLTEGLLLSLVFALHCLTSWHGLKRQSILCALYCRVCQKQALKCPLIAHGGRRTQCLCTLSRKLLSTSSLLWGRLRGTWKPSRAAPAVWAAAVFGPAVARALQRLLLARTAAGISLCVVTSL